MNIHKTLVQAFVVLVLLLCVTQAQNCDANYASQLVKNFNSYITSFDSDSAYSQADNIDAIRANLTAALAPCIGKIGGFVNTVEQISITVQTQECMRNFDLSPTSAWSQDPCCNWQLQDQQCCIPRNMTFSRNFATTFKPLMLANCKNPLKVAALLRRFQRVQAVAEATCKSAFGKTFSELGDLQQQFIGCVNNMNMDGLYCASNSDCDSGICNPYTNTCGQAGFDVTSSNNTVAAVARCIIKAASNFVLRGIILRLGLTGQSYDVNSFGDRLINEISEGKCVNSDGVPQPQFTTRQSCENVTACIDSKGATCANSNYFCGAFCSPLTGQCKNDITTIYAFITFNQNTCENIGRCYQAGQIVSINGRDFVNKSDCESSSFCAGAPNGCTNCDTNQATCQNSGRCLGFPGTFIRTALLKPTGLCTKQKTGLFCPFGLTFDLTLNLCIKFAQSSSDCGIGETFLAAPASQSECENNYKWCREPNGRFTRKQGADCTACGGVLVNQFKWIPAKYTTRLFSPIGQWVQRQVKPSNKWVKGFSPSKFETFVRFAMNIHYKPLLKSALYCQYAPLVELIDTLNCDCQANGTACFDIQKKVNIGSLIAYSGVAQQYKLVDVTVTTTPTSVSATTDNVEITVTKSDAPVDSTKNARESLAVSYNTVNVVGGSGAVVGQVVGDGYALSAATNDYVTLCIKVNTEIQVGATFTAPAFVYKDASGNFVIASVKATQNTNGEMCALVKDTTVYYPAMTTAGATPASSTTPKSAASSTFQSTFAVLLVVAAYIVSLFM